MSSFIVMCIQAVICSLIIVYGVRRWALRHMLDIPNERSSHTSPTPRGGGLSIVVTTVILFVFTIFVGEFNTIEAVPMLLIFIIGGVIIAALGWIDDRVSLSAKLRLVLQLGVSTVEVILIGAVAQVELPLLGVIGFMPLIAYLLNIIWVVGFTNIYNFMDGIDGLAGSQALIAGLGWCGLLLAQGQPTLALYSALLASSSLGFLFLNRPRALIFMGDVGSTFIGFSLAMLPLLVFTRTNDPRLLVAGALFVAPFVLDGTFTIIRRALRGENVLKPHRSHIYQRLTQQGYTHLQITALYALYAFVSMICGWLYAFSGEWIAIIVPLAIFAGLVFWAIRQERGAVRLATVSTS